MWVDWFERSKRFFACVHKQYEESKIRTGWIMVFECVKGEEREGVWCAPVQKPFDSLISYPLLLLMTYSYLLLSSYTFTSAELSFPSSFITLTTLCWVTKCMEDAVVVCMGNASTEQVDFMWCPCPVNIRPEALLGTLVVAHTQMSVKGQLSVCSAESSSTHWHTFSSYLIQLPRIYDDQCAKREINGWNKTVKCECVWSVSFVIWQVEVGFEKFLSWLKVCFGAALIVLTKTGKPTIKALFLVKSFLSSSHITKSLIKHVFIINIQPSVFVCTCCRDGSGEGATLAVWVSYGACVSRAGSQGTLQHNRPNPNRPPEAAALFIAERVSLSKKRNISLTHLTHKYTHRWT